MFGYGLAYGPGAPGFRLTGAGRIEVVTGIAELRQSLLMLLATTPGERPLAPTFGCALDRLAFEPIDDTTAGLAIRMVAEAVAQQLPQVQVDRLDAGPDPADPGRLRIELWYRDRRSGTTDTLSLTLPVEGAA
jgi:Bacteriophage baseplate protein W